jgi:hypothetical protein
MRGKRSSTPEPELRVKFVPSGDPSTEDERMADFLKWLLERSRAINAKQEAA